MTAQSDGSVEHKLEHYRQRSNWDCGVSCIIMLLPKHQREEMINNFDQICQEEGFQQSTWTIDLCYLLKRFGIRHVMHTMTLGVNESYRRHDYYDKVIKIDRERVLSRFAGAESRGVVVRRRELGARELGEHVARRGPAVLLVDAGLLVCDLCKHNKIKAEFRRCFGGSYSGHYIVVVGYRRGKLLYRDPALSPRLCAAGPGRLARAARASGTDRDVILVFNDYSFQAEPVTIFNNYFVEQWLEPPEMIPLWCCFKEHHRSTNLVEAWNERFQRYTGCKPSLLLFLQTVATDISTHDIARERLQMNGIPIHKRKKTSIQNDELINKLTHQYENKERSITNFLQEVSSVLKIVF